MTATIRTYENVAKLVGKLPVIVIIVLPLFGCVKGYEVEFRNNFFVPLRIEVRQFHASDFRGIRDINFPEKNLVHYEEFLITPQTKIKREYNDSTGGFWVLWSAISQDGKLLCKGEVAFTGGQAPFVVILDSTSCASG